MLYFLKNEKKQSAWQPMFESIIEGWLKYYNYNFLDTTLEGLKDLKEDDYVMVMHFSDFLKPEVLETKAKVIGKVNGTSANPFVYQVNPDEEAEQFKSAIDILWVDGPRVADAVAKKFVFLGEDMPEIWTVGFPVEIPSDIKIEAYKTSRIEKSIIVPGRISPDKQFYLSAFMLMPYLEQGYKVTFAVTPTEDNRKWLEFYGEKKFTDLGFEFKFMDRDEFLLEAAQHEYVFMTSLGDVWAISLIEALLLGCYPLIPRFGKGLPAYDSYLTVGYEPYSLSSLDKLIKEKPRFTFDKSAYDPALVVSRLVSYLQGEL